MPESVLKQKYFHGVPLKKMLRMLPGNTEVRHINISETSFDIESVINPEKLLDVVQNFSFQIDERLPYWSELWPSSFALAEYILENQSVFKEKNILEIGCGLGLCGFAARKTGARIHFTDNDPIALYFTKRNYQRNFTDHPDVYYLDWRGPYPKFRFDAIIGADILYEKRFFQPLFFLVETLLESGGHFIIAEPQRSIAKDFFELFASEKWIHTVTNKSINRGNSLNSVDIYHYRIC